MPFGLPGHFPLIPETMHMSSQCKYSDYRLEAFQSSFTRQILPRQCKKIVGIKLPATSIAEEIPALGAIPTLSNIYGNLRNCQHL